MKTQVKPITKYDRLYSKIKNYHLGKLQMERNEKIKFDENGNYSKEYGRLVKAKKDIQDSIKNHISYALIFSEIIRMGEHSKSSRKHDPDLQIQKLDQDEDLAKYELTGDDGKVREEISDLGKEFARDIFDEETIRRLLNAIFFQGYHSRIMRNDQKHTNYIINVAKMLSIRAINELMHKIDSPFSEYLKEDLQRAAGICNAVGAKPPTKGEAIRIALKKILTK